MLRPALQWIASIVTSEFIVQAAHALLGAVCVFAPRALARGYFAAIVVSAAFWTYAIGKELWFDEVYENATVRGSGVRDLVFLLGGNLLAWALVLLLRR